jgi:superfamily II DNA/RNA helicase
MATGKRKQRSKSKHHESPDEKKKKNTRVSPLDQSTAIAKNAIDSVEKVQEAMDADYHDTNNIIVTMVGLEVKPMATDGNTVMAFPPPPFSIASWRQPTDIFTAAAPSVEASSLTTLPSDLVVEPWMQYRNAWNRDKKRRQWTPTLIQRQIWPMFWRNPKKLPTRINLIAISPTSSGKTLAYGIPMLACPLPPQPSHHHRHHQKANGKSSSHHGSIVGLVLVPTRELCQQVQQAFKDKDHVLAIHGTSSGGTVGGLDQRDEQVAMLKQPRKRPTIVIATPGRLLDLLSHQKRIPLLFSNLEYFVLDEADRLATNQDMAQQVDQIRNCLGMSHSFSSSSTDSKQQQQEWSHPTPAPTPTVALFSATSPYKARKKWLEWVGSSHVRVQVMHSLLTTAGTGHQRKPLVIEDDATSVSAATHDVAENLVDQTSSRTANGEPIQLDILSKIPAHLVQTLQVCTTAEKSQRLWTTLNQIRTLDGRQRSLVLVFFREIATLRQTSKLLLMQQEQQQGWNNSNSNKPSSSSSVKKNSNGNNMVWGELHGKLTSQAARDQALQNFRSGKIPILLSTDICARGIHVPNVWYVINYDFPDDREQVRYTHTHALVWDKTIHHFAAGLYSYEMDGRTVCFCLA